MIKTFTKGVKDAWHKIQSGADHSDIERGKGRGKLAELSRKHGISEATIYNWKAKYGDMTVSEANGSSS